MEGMLIASELSSWKGDLPHTEYRLLKSILESAGVMNVHKLPEQIIRLITRDKKGEADALNMVLLQSIGKAVVRKMPINELKAFTDYYMQRKD
jgi:3-dehydroquinate synthetase